MTRAQTLISIKNNEIVSILKEYHKDYVCSDMNNNKFNVYLNLNSSETKISDIIWSFAHSTYSTCKIEQQKAS